MVEINKVLEQLTTATSASQFLQTKDLPFYKSLSKPFSDKVAASGGRLLALCNTLVGKLAPPGGGPEPLEDLDDVVDRFDGIVDILDNLLEKADVCLDEVAGRLQHSRNPGTVPAQSAPVVVKLTDARTGKTSDYVHAKNIARPQLRFEDRPDNSSRPFVRKLRVKHHAKKPLEEAGDGHPYEYEISNIQYPSWLFEISPEILYTDFDTSTYTFVDTEEKLDAMIAHLNASREIAIDLEVLHGAESDIIWLQKDFGVYIVNLFDTFHASHVLELEKHGLAFLLQMYCNVETNKAYQLADWRIRHGYAFCAYARMDTHYLLYIFDRMRNETLLRSDSATKQLLHVVLTRSERTSLNVYVKEPYDAEGDGPVGWRTQLRKVTIPMSPEQVAAYKAVHAWRDRIAREEDESARYVLPNFMLANLATRMPKDERGVFACCNPVPNLVRMYAGDLVIAMEQARVKAAVEAERRAKENGTLTHPGAIDVTLPIVTSSVHKRFDDDNGAPILLELDKGFFVSTLNDKKENGKTCIRAVATLEVRPFSRMFDVARGDVEPYPKLREAERVRQSLFLISPGFELVRKRKEREDAERAAAEAEKGEEDMELESEAVSSPDAKKRKKDPYEIVQVGKKAVKKARVLDEPGSGGPDVLYRKPDGGPSEIEAHKYPKKGEAYEVESKKRKNKDGENEIDFNPYGEVDDSKIAKKREPKVVANINRSLSRGKSMTYKK
ncbi:exosome nuclease subunit [Irineochytrium annulatum]|nr:exosome nuclease subunit [Irineochytrium annulatum]